MPLVYAVRTRPITGIGKRNCASLLGKNLAMDVIVADFRCIFAFETALQPWELKPEGT